MNSINFPIPKIRVFLLTALIALFLLDKAIICLYRGSTCYKLTHASRRFPVDGITVAFECKVKE